MKYHVAELKEGYSEVVGTTIGMSREAAIQEARHLKAANPTKDYEVMPDVIMGMTRPTPVFTTRNRQEP